MLTHIIMFGIVLFLGALLIFHDSKGKQTSFFDRSATSSMRGFWCLIILLVHIPPNHQNRIQDLIGSFAYIGVTFFFMTSGYGLMLGIQKNEQSIKKGFWLRRLPKLLLPMFLVNVISVLSELIITGKIQPLDLLFITGWVRQLLLFYLVVWLICRFAGEKVSALNKERIICVCVLVLSLVFYFSKGKLLFAWPTESLGFLYGVLLARYKEEFKKFAVNKWWLNSACAGIASLLFGVLYLKIKHIDFLGDYVVKALLGLFIITLILFANTRIPIGNALNRFLGKISYEVYLLHTVSFVILEALPINMNSGIFILSSIIITVVLSLLVNVLSSTVLNGFKKIKAS